MDKIAKSSDYTNKQLEYNDKAYLCLKNNDLENYFINKRESFKYCLLGYQIGHVKEVEILDAGDSSCAICQSLRRKKYTIQEALKTMPIPVKNCKNDYGFCRCIYLPIVEI